VQLGSNSPIIEFDLPASVFAPGGVVDRLAIQNYIVGVLNTYLHINSIPASAIVILSVTLPNGIQFDYSKRDPSPDDILKVTFGFSDLASSFTAQQLGATFIEAADTKGLPPVSNGGVTPSSPALAPNSPLIAVLALTPTTGTGDVVGKSGGSSNNAGISKGALAGIIIGVFFGAVIIVAILFFLAVRRRDSYPMAFRSPAAAYRP
jgi:hypothetical protein